MVKYPGHLISLWLLSWTLLSALSPCAAAAPNLIPAPLEMTRKSGNFRLTADTRIYYTRGASAIADYLSAELAPALGWSLPAQAAEAWQAGGILLELNDEPQSAGDNRAPGDESYLLTVDENGVRISAAGPAGLFYGVQSLRQLFPVEIFAKEKQERDWTIPCVRIADQPAFSWRGMLLDVGRHFMPVDFIKQFIDQLALHKMNRFHWHLTDDQGWRLEIKRYPLLTGVGAWRDETLVGHYGDSRRWWNRLFPWIEPVHQYDGQRYGGFYTRQQVRDIVDYARTRHVMVVPEIEMPGHAQAAVAAYPELGSSDEAVGVKRGWGVSPYIYNPEQSTIDFLKNVLTEVMELFPDDYIHIGGDEARKDQWINNPRVQLLMEERGLENEEEMQSWFIRQIDEFLSQNGRRLIGWDEILQGGLARGATVMSWRGATGGIAAARAGHDVVMADNNYTYFDHYQSESGGEPLAIGGYIPLKKVYYYDPIPGALTEEESSHILGAQGQLWTEYIKTPEHVEYMAFPRVSALAEVVWLNQEPEQRDYQAFLQRLDVHLQRLEIMNINYRQPEED